MPESTCPAGKGETEWADKQQILGNDLRSFNRVHKSDGTLCGEGCERRQGKETIQTFMDEPGVEYYRHAAIGGAWRNNRKAHEKLETVGEELEGDLMIQLGYIGNGLSSSAKVVRAGVATIRSLQQENKELQSIKGILAVIHRDGGHHTESVGIKQSVEDGHKVWADLIEKLEQKPEPVGGKEWNRLAPLTADKKELGNPKELRRLINNHASGMAEHKQEIRWLLATIRSLQAEVKEYRETGEQLCNGYGLLCLEYLKVKKPLPEYHGPGVGCSHKERAEKAEANITRLRKALEAVRAISPIHATGSGETYQYTLEAQELDRKVFAIIQDALSKLAQRG